MAEIYFPIDASDLKNMVPPGEEIIYSTLAKGFTTFVNKRFNWVTPILMTSNGVIYKKPDVTKRKAPLFGEYTLWGEVANVAGGTKLGTGIMIYGISLNFTRDPDFETKEKYRERCASFVRRFLPFLIKKKRIWLEEAQNDPEIKKSNLKFHTKWLSRLLKWNAKFKAKEAKNKK
ncbi:MAG: hypothetical protein ACFFAS_20605 [Promethearchaeota archaeon]